jgi:hypothetical protein
LDALDAGQPRDLAVDALQQQQVVALEEVAVGLERDHEDLVVAEPADRSLVDGARRVAARSGGSVDGSSARRSPGGSSAPRRGRCE